MSGSTLLEQVEYFVEGTCEILGGTLVARWGFEPEPEGEVMERSAWSRFVGDACKIRCSYNAHTNEMEVLFAETPRSRFAAYPARFRSIKEPTVPLSLFDVLAIRDPSASRRMGLGELYHYQSESVIRGAITWATERVQEYCGDLLRGDFSVAAAVPRRLLADFSVRSALPRFWEDNGPALPAYKDDSREVLRIVVDQFPELDSDELARWWLRGGSSVFDNDQGGWPVLYYVHYPRLLAMAREGASSDLAGWTDRLARICNGDARRSDLLGVWLFWPLADNGQEFAAVREVIGGELADAADAAYSWRWPGKE